MKKLIGNLIGLKRKLEETQKGSAKYSSRVRARLEHIDHLDAVRSHAEQTRAPPVKKRPSISTNANGNGDEQSTSSVAGSSSAPTSGSAVSAGLSTLTSSIRSLDGTNAAEAKESKDAKDAREDGLTLAQQQAKEDAENVQQARLAKRARQTYVRALKRALTVFSWTIHYVNVTLTSPCPRSCRVPRIHLLLMTLTMR